MEPIPGHSGRVIDEVLCRLGPNTDNLVATGHQATALTAHLAEHWPRVRTFEVEDLDDMPRSVADGLARLARDWALVVEGDVIVPARSMQAFVADANVGGAALRLLLGPRKARADRATVDLAAGCTAREVRPSRSEDKVRWAVLAAACSADVQQRVTALCGPFAPLSGLGVSIWHAAAARLLSDGEVVRVMCAPDSGVNVNSPLDLAAASAYVQHDTAESLADRSSRIQR